MEKESSIVLHLIDPSISYARAAPLSLPPTSKKPQAPERHAARRRIIILAGLWPQANVLLINPTSMRDGPQQRAGKFRFEKTSVDLIRIRKVLMAVGKTSKAL